MTTLRLEKILAPILPKGKNLQHFMKDALVLQLQDTSRKIAVFEAKHNQTFLEFEKKWDKSDDPARYSYEIESDYLDWEALEQYKRQLMKVIQSL